MKILLVEDSPRLQRSLSIGLQSLGFVVDQAYDGLEAMEFIALNQYDVIVLDLMLPKVGGLTVLTKLRLRGNGAHVLILSAKDQTEDRIRGLDLGADDYLVKPFSFEELVSRLRALIRRSVDSKCPAFEVGPLQIDTVRRIVYCEGGPVSLTPLEFTLLELLARQRGRVFSHGQLIEQLYDATSCVTKNAIEARVSGLRKKLSAVGAGDVVKTRRGFGYAVE